MRQPGLMACGFFSQRNKFVVELASTPAPRIERSARCVKSGAAPSDAAETPRMEWQLTQVWVVKTFQPFRAESVTGGGADFCCSRSHAANSSGDSMTTTARIQAWPTPQYSTQFPRNLPGFLASNQM